MDNDYSYDNGGRRRTIIIVSVVAVAVIIGIAVIVLLVVRARSGATGLPARGTKTSSQAPGTQGTAVVPLTNLAPAAAPLQTTPDPEKYAAGANVNRPVAPPQAAATQKPIPDHTLTADEKKQYGYPATWTVLWETVLGPLGPQTQLTVTDKGSGKAYPDGMEKTTTLPKK